MLQQFMAAMLPTLTGLGAWLAARREPARLRVVEAKVDETLLWQAKHERRHYMIEGDAR